MRRAMAAAEVGDDVFGEDPTVNRLQEKVAGLLGKEAGLYVPSGTMSNQLALKTHTNPGDEVIVEKDSHIFNYETAAPALLSG
ncbi:MAG: threonine aldolase family protein, partial [Bacteroidetes bacterium]|nr:threonine aldolase family protein [Bacteroidota bacterium]